MRNGVGKRVTLASVLVAAIVVGGLASTARAETVTPTVTRISGEDRFEVAVKVSQMLSPSTTDEIYVASGSNFPDALSAGPAAIHWTDPLLIVTPDRIPPRVASEIIRLKPSVIKVVGGERSVSNAVFEELKVLVPGVRLFRIGGADRYEVSRAVVRDAFSRAHMPVLVTGATFPDALSSAPTTTQAGDPVLLVDGRSGGADTPTRELLESLDAAAARIVGGRDSISEAFEKSLATVLEVHRIEGADRFEASVNVNRVSFTTAETVYLATGLNFPDALTGGVLAADSHSPLYVVPTNSTVFRAQFLLRSLDSVPLESSSSVARFPSPTTSLA